MAADEAAHGTVPAPGFLLRGVFHTAPGTVCMQPVNPCDVQRVHLCESAAV